MLNTIFEKPQKSDFLTLKMMFKAKNALFWIPEGTLYPKMTKNMSIFNFHTFPCHKMTLIGPWKAIVGPKLTQKSFEGMAGCEN